MAGPCHSNKEYLREPLMILKKLKQKKAQKFSFDICTVIIHLQEPYV
jgi:hypothetical protein